MYEEIKEPNSHQNLLNYMIVWTLSVRDYRGETYLPATQNIMIDGNLCVKQFTFSSVFCHGRLQILKM